MSPPHLLPPQRICGSVCLCHRGKKKSTEGSCTCAAWWLSLDSALHIMASPRMSDLTEVTSVPHMPAQTRSGADRQDRRLQLTVGNIRGHNADSVEEKKKKKSTHNTFKVTTDHSARTHTHTSLWARRCSTSLKCINCHVCDSRLKIWCVTRGGAAAGAGLKI